MKVLRLLTLVALPLVISDLANSAVIYVDANASGDDNGSNWKDAYPKLQDAINAATGGDTIRIAEGKYYPDEGVGQSNNSAASVFEIASKLTVEGGFPSGGGGTADPQQFSTVLSGDLAQDDVELDKNGITSSPADRNGLNAWHVVKIPAAADSVTIRGVVITGGNAAGSGANQRGGGILLETDASLLLENCWMAGNEASTRGGGISAERQALQIVNCRFTGNSAPSGGAFHCAQGTVNMKNAAISGNLAEIGGGIFFDGVGAEFINTSFSGNAATAKGGAIALENSSVLQIKNTIAWSNSVEGDLGANGASILINGGSTAIYSYSLMSGLDLTGTGTSNFNGKDPENSPNFYLEPNPISAPSSIGNLRLRPTSPLIDQASSSANNTSTDLAGEPRKIGAIDLGAYEFQRVIYANDTASGAGHGGSWQDAFPKLQDALAAAEVGWTIQVARGVYFPDEGSAQTNNDNQSTFLLRNGITLQGGYLGSGEMRNPKLWKSVLSGDLQGDDLNPDADKIAGGPVDIKGNNARHVVTGSGTNATAVMDGFVVTAGNAIQSFDSVQSETGGGMIIENGSPTITGCDFIGNHAYQNGGAVSALLTGTNPIFRNCTFLWNDVSGSSSPVAGGAVYATGSASPSFVSCEFRANFSQFYGGAIGAYESTLTAQNCLFSGNRANGRGGAISLIASTLHLTGSTLSANTAFESTTAGGAIYSASGDLIAKNSVMWNNRAASNLGGYDSSYTVLYSIFDPDPATTNFNHCLIEGRNLTSSGSGNLDGSLPANNPKFLIAAGTFGAPHADGDFHLATASPAAGQGDNSLATELTDLDGESRLQGTTIDLGAYEGTDIDPDLDNDGLPNVWEFANTNPPSETQLDPLSDADKDGLTALQEYAHGLNPNVGNKTADALYFTKFFTGGSDYSALTCFRKTAVEKFVKFRVEQSEDLGENDAWSTLPMIFTNSNNVSFTYRSELPFSARDRQFLRLVVEKIGP